MDVREFTRGPFTLDEMMKVLSILENPDDAREVRKALRFYELPKAMEYKWGDNAAVMERLRSYSVPVPVDDIAERIKTEGCGSLLVVGDSFGGILTKLVCGLQKGSQVVVVSWKRDDVPEHLNQIATLKETCRQIMKLGAKIELFIGNPMGEKLSEAVSGYGPFDFVFVKGDLSLKAKYDPMGKEVIHKE